MEISVVRSTKFGLLGVNQVKATRVITFQPVMTSVSLVLQRHLRMEFRQRQGEGRQQQRGDPRQHQG